MFGSVMKCALNGSNNTESPTSSDETQQLKETIARLKQQLENKEIDLKVRPITLPVLCCIFAGFLFSYGAIWMFP